MLYPTGGANEASDSQSNPSSSLTRAYTSTAPKASKFKPAKAPAPSQKPSRKPEPATLPSFSTPGYGRLKPAVPPGPRHLSQSYGTIDISSSESSPSSPTGGLPVKRTSSDMAFPLPQLAASKRQKTANCSDKENFSSSWKGKGRAMSPHTVKDPTPANSALSADHSFCAPRDVDHGLFHFPRHTNPSAVPHLPRDHDDLRSMTLDELRLLYAANHPALLKAQKDKMEFRVNMKKTQDIYVLNGIIHLVDERMRAIDAMISAREREQLRQDQSLLDEEKMSLSSCILTSEVTDAPLLSTTPLQDLAASTLASHPSFSPHPSSYSDPRMVVTPFERTELLQPESEEELWGHIADGDDDDIVVMEHPPSSSTLTTLPGRATAGISSSTSIDFQTHRHYPEILDILKKTFRLSEFRKNQLEAIVHTLEGSDVFVLMPTGGGKSLCYQVPALCNGGTTRGVTIVISPLLALMFDQVEDLRTLGVDVGLFASDQTLVERNHTRQRLLSPMKPSLVYITPEKLNLGGDMSNILRRLYAEKMLARFVVDEAHLINTWGRDFRDAYAALSNLRRDFPGIPIMALTATATPNAQQDIIHSLGLHDYKFLAQSFNRPNLRYRVMSKPRTPVQAIAKYIKEAHSGHTGIVYCIGREKCERVASDLRKDGINARHFHAKMADADKKRTHDAWKTGECTVIVGTIAFGMGINKANVRYVIHHDMPSSLAGYLQETGRAGRDGEVSDCLLYYSWQDGQMLLRRVRENPDLGAEEIRRQEEEVRAVIQFCLNDTDCRRVQLLTRFDETFHPEMCAGTCDNCVSIDGVLEQDLSTAAKNFIRLLQQVERRNDNITRGHCIATFRGLQPKELIEKGYHKLGLYGIGKDIEQGQAERLFDHLLMFEAFKSVSTIVGKYPVTYIRLGPKHGEILSGKHPLIMRLRIKKAKAPVSKKAAPGSKRKAARAEIVDDPIELYRDDEDEDFPPIASASNTIPETPSSTQSMLKDAGSDPPDHHQQCYVELCSVRARLSLSTSVEEQEIFSDETLQLLSIILPADGHGFKAVLESSPDAEDMDAKWKQYGADFLHVCTNRTIRHPAGGLSQAASKTFASQIPVAELHGRYAYRDKPPSSRAK